MIFLSGCIFILLILISSIHFYWLLGGKWALHYAVPITDGEKEPRLPPFFLTFLVAIIFLCFALFFLQNTQLVLLFPLQVVKYGILIVGILFSIRAIGDFKYVGFFKTKKNSEFAKYDTLLYTPLSSCIGVLSLIIYFFK